MAKPQQASCHLFAGRVNKFEEKKKNIVEQFKENLSKDNSTFVLNKNTSNLFRRRNLNQVKKLDVKQLNRVISIDPVNLVAEVEAMITYEDLVAETLKYDCLPPVVPELKTITVGGALVGLGIEASSFRYGLVHETILEIEVLTGDGKVLICRPDNEHSDLFFAFPNSYGTLGYALRIKLKLIPAKKFVRLTNLRFNDIDTYFAKLKELCLNNRAISYIDGVIFNQSEMYIILGEFVDQAPFVSDYTYMSIYYKSIRHKETNYLTAHDYIWRWDTDWFWCSKHFGMNSKILRLLFGKFVLRSAVYWKLSHLVASNPLLKWIASLFEKPSESVIQDILIPIQNAPAFYDFFQSKIGITPIWICPFHFLRPDRNYPLFPLDPKDLYMDFGFWDIVPSIQPKGTLNKLIERKAEELHGYKSLYSDSFYTEDQFWRIHSKSAFTELKAKYDPKKAFKGLYEKCVLRK
jgi:FAD/FMN-containing dehydrogenase